MRGRDIYKRFSLKEIKNFLKSRGHRVIGFRPPRTGEKYLGIFRPPAVITAVQDFGETKRIILQ